MDELADDDLGCSIFKMYYINRNKTNIWNLLIYTFSVRKRAHSWWPYKNITTSNRTIIQQLPCSYKKKKSFFYDKKALIIHFCAILKIKLLWQYH
jgi:hypothetical protein